MNRKNPLERSGNALDATKTSILTPTWMQIPVNKELIPKNPLESTTFGCLRQEANRTYLAEKEQPQKSIFSLGAFRHNVAFADQAQASIASPKLAMVPTRLIEWKEDINKQKFDS